MWMPAQTTAPPWRWPAGPPAPAPRPGRRRSPRRAARAAPRPEEPAHSAPSPRANACVLLVARAGEREDAAALVDGDLAEDVGGGAEAVEADPLGIADQAQRPVADQPGAEQRRRLHVRVALGDREAKRSSATASSA